MATNDLMRALVIGAFLAIGAIGVFLLMYFIVLAGAEDAARLFGSLLVPPLVLAVILGLYFILNQPKQD